MSLSRRLETVAPALISVGAWALALLIAAWLAAAWYWRIKAPPLAARPQTNLIDPTVASRDVASRHLFGEAPALPAGGVPAQPQSHFALVGVAAHSGTSPGFVVLQEDGKVAQGFVLGEEVSPGVKLAKITADSVELERGGARETLRLPENVNRAAANPQGAVGGAPVNGTAPQNFVVAQPAPSWTPPSMPSGMPNPQPGMQINGVQQNGMMMSNGIVPPQQNAAPSPNFENRPTQ